MEKTTSKGQHDGYKIGEDILIHKHIHCPGDWVLTIRSLKIFSVSLCSQDCTEKEIARHVMNKVAPIENEVQKIVKLLKNDGMEEQKYTSLELEAMKWLKETDEMQFDQWELLAMFVRHCLALPKILDEDVKAIVDISETRQVISEIRNLK